MTDTGALLLAFMAGVLLGTLFFIGLWWSVRRALQSPRPTLWLLGGGALRLSLAVAGFYLVGGGQVGRLLACLVGFVAARMVVMRVVGRTPAPGVGTPVEGGHGP
jgi:F1F0 ATPase subunit 2